MKITLFFFLSLATENEIQKNSFSAPTPTRKSLKPLDYSTVDIKVETECI